MSAQEKPLKMEIPVHRQYIDERNLSEFNQVEETNFYTDDFAEAEFAKLRSEVVFAAEPVRKREHFIFLEDETEQNTEKIELNELELNRETLREQIRHFKVPEKNFDDSTVENKEKFHWKPAMIQSGLFLGIQHGFRLLQRKTQRELDGPFFRDWGKSIKSLHGWADGDNTFINYVGHPMQGAATGRIFINNSDKSKKLEFGNSKDYWTSRMKAMAWSAVWSTQFEFGPVSEANIGNVGLNNQDGTNGMAWVDLIMTPTAGTGVLIGEDIIDKYILKNWLEKKLTSRTRIKVYRTFFNPISSFVNILSGKKPWTRYNR